MDKKGMSPKIPIIGFGSLIWSPRNLKLASGWHKDGPLLPIEYARISQQDCRLTLVIVPGVEPQKTLWAYSSCSNVSDAKENLREREGKTKSEYIGVWNAGTSSNSDPVVTAISSWAREKGLTSVIWTALPARDQLGQERPMSAGEALAYLSSLEGGTKQKAEEYITKTPEQINTEIRKVVSERLGWADYPLPSKLFED